MAASLPSDLLWPVGRRLYSPHTAHAREECRHRACRGPACCALRTFGYQDHKIPPQQAEQCGVGNDVHLRKIGLRRIVLNESLVSAMRRARGVLAVCLVAGYVLTTQRIYAAEGPATRQPRDYRFDKTMPREVLENYLSRAISMEGLLNGRGDLDDNIRMLKSIGAKFVGRSLCLWGGEVNLLRNLERARQQLPKVHKADPGMILQGCVFEIVTAQVDQVPVPDW